MDLEKVSLIHFDATVSVLSFAFWFFQPQEIEVDMQNVNLRLINI